jgi:hypothetical protein
MVRRLFTPVQANQTLPLVRRVVADILQAGRELHEFAGTARRREAHRERLEELQSRVDRLMKELEAIGCSYKDWSFEVGLVDFPSKIGGRRVLLCWRSDEDRVEHYHAYEEGYAGRRPIPEHLLEAEPNANANEASDAKA